MSDYNNVPGLIDGLPENNLIKSSNNTRYELLSFFSFYHSNFIEPYTSNTVEAQQ